jgi:L1 cell adhesion molecule like protein
MIEIMETLQQYVPLVGDESDQKAHQILFGGDQLTAARARGCAELRINSDTLTGRLKTLVPVFEDWHTSVTLLTICTVHMHLYTVLTS